MNTTAPRILSCGEILWDLFPDGPRFGGAPANFAVQAAMLGARVSVLGAVGCDARGSEAVSILNGFGIDTSLIQSIPDAPTGAVLVSVDAAGKPGFTIQPDAAWDRLTWTEALADSIERCDAVYFGTLGQRSANSRATIRRALEAAKVRGILRVLDINLRAPFYDQTLLRESLELASVLKLSDEELPAVAAACAISPADATHGALKQICQRFSLACVAMTRGADGALLLSDGAIWEQPGIPVPVVDTVGAGDAFTAALVTGLLESKPPSAILSRACETASAACAHAGAIPPAASRRGPM
jgi:fructokinase